MAVTLSVEDTGTGVRVATYVGDAGAGNGGAVEMASHPIKSVQRTSGTGTYTVQGSNDGTAWGALSTAISAANDANIRPITDNPRFLRVVTSAAAATVVIVGY